MKSVTVNFSWIRHGFSCANRIRAKATSFVNTLKGAYISVDPVLANEGVEQAKKLNGIIKEKQYKFDAVLCSNLKRAMETALYAFNGTEMKTLYVVPFVSEARAFLGLDKENEPQGSQNLKSYYTSLANEKFSMNVDFSILEHYEKISNDIGPNYDQFIKLVVPEIIGKIGDKNKYDIAVVSHNYFIKDHINSNPQLTEKFDELNNTQMWKESVTVDVIPTVVNYRNNVLDCKDDMCSIGLQKQYDGVKTPLVPGTIGPIGRCKIQGESYIKLDQQGGSNRYYHKYMKYKSKYIQKQI